MATYPALSSPQSTTDAGIISTIPLDEIHIEDLLSGCGFGFLIAQCDSENTNKAASKMRMSELRNKAELMAVNQLCPYNTLSNSTIWELGRFPFGSLLRTSHVYEARRFRRLGEYVGKVPVTPFLEDPLITSETAQEYFRNSQGELLGGPTSARFARRANAEM